MDITAGGFRILHGGRWQAVFHHAKDAAGLQRGIGVIEEFLFVPAGHPVVDVAESQHGVRRAGLGQRAAVCREAGIVIVPNFGSV
jgi:hypothetical protein